MKITQDVRDYAATLNEQATGMAASGLALERQTYDPSGLPGAGSRHGGDEREVRRHGGKLYVEAETASTVKMQAIFRAKRAAPARR